MSITSKSKFRTSAAGLVAVLALSTGLLAACTTTQAATTGNNAQDAVVAPMEGAVEHGSDHGRSDAEDAGSVAKKIALYSAMHDLWGDHMQWTLSTVDAFFHNPDGLDANLKRLLQNQKDIGAAIVPFYGQEAGDKLAALLTVHIEDAVPVLQAAKAGDEEALNKGLEVWYANAKEVAAFLTAANPEDWPASATEPMMKGHIDQTTAYAVALLTGDFEGAVAGYDEARHHMLMLADILAEGLINQFPEDF